MDESHVDCYTREGLVKDLAVRNELGRYVIDMFVCMNEYYASGRFVSSRIENGVEEMMDLGVVDQCVTNVETQR